MIARDESNEERMRYAIVGGDGMSEQQKLSHAKGEVGWSYLAPHYLNGSLYYVDPGLELVPVGLAFANNETKRVEAWLKSGEIVKIEKLHVAQWESVKDDETLRFEALVVSPFVLCRPL
jgi:hypothetical protein